MIPCNALLTLLRTAMATASAVGLAAAEDNLIIRMIVGDFVLAPSTEFADLEFPDATQQGYFETWKKSVELGNQLHGIDALSGNINVTLVPATNWEFKGDDAALEGAPVTIFGFALCNADENEVLALEKLAEPVVIDGDDVSYVHPDFSMLLPPTAFV